MKQMQHIFSVATHDLKRVGMVFLLGLTCCLALQAQHSRRDDDAALRKLQLAEMAIYNLYVDSVNQNKLVEDGIRGMIEKLDPHSSYSTAQETKAMNEPLQGSFEGIDAVAVYGCVVVRSSWTVLRSVQHGVVSKLVASRKELFYLGVLGGALLLFFFHCSYFFCLLGFELSPEMGC